MHHDPPMSQTPALQSFEQQSALSVQALPEVRHEPLSGWHFPPVQLPPQHWPLLVHAPLSETQIFPSHTPPLHASEQQSVPAAQEPPAATHRPTVDAQVRSTESQIPEQQSLPLPHVSPVTPQALASFFLRPVRSPSEVVPPQLAMISATMKSPYKDFGMTFLPRCTIGDRSSSGRTCARRRPHGRQWASTRFSLLAGQTIAAFAPKLVTRVTKWPMK
jgi:hypothetical protein